ncbi:MAG: hypothetical protein IBX55_00300 [Methyloprofundus sp.]|nr:hypothetical protein [Methyloprofundus sp.]
MRNFLSKIGRSLSEPISPGYSSRKEFIEIFDDNDTLIAEISSSVMAQKIKIQPDIFKIVEDRILFKEFACLEDDYLRLFFKENYSFKPDNYLRYLFEISHSQNDSLSPVI